MHLDDGQIQRFVDAELTAASAVEARAHMDGCGECRARMAAAKEEDAWVLERLRELDHPAPRVRVETIVRAVDRRAPRWGRWAASILVTVSVAGVAYAAPGSPLPELIGRFTEWMRGDHRAATVPATPTERIASGTAMTPGDHLRIVFLAEQPGGVALVSLTDAAIVEVRALDRPAEFTLDPDRISIDNAASTARFEVDIPSSAPRVEILVGDRRILLKESTRVVTDAPRDLDGRYRVSLSPVRR
jgi:hypothetical protein